MKKISIISFNFKLTINFFNFLISIHTTSQQDPFLPTIMLFFYLLNLTILILKFIKLENIYTKLLVLELLYCELVHLRL
jgi:hypothetical protein